MKSSVSLTLSAFLLLSSAASPAQGVKTYKHASQYQVGTLDENVRVLTGVDATAAKSSTDAKLGPGGQNVHLIHTEGGDYRIEAPINHGLSMLSAMNSNAYRPAQTVHNKWFLDNLQVGTKVLFAPACAKPNKSHPTATVRCTFYLPDPDSTDHEYATTGDFAPFVAGDGSNTTKVANALCGTGKLNAAAEAQLCSQAPPPVGK